MVASLPIPCVLEEALGSRAKVGILRALASRGEATTEQLCRATGQSTGTLGPALQQLVASGVLEADPPGRGRAYRISGDHPLASQLKRLMAEETSAIDRACDEVVRRSAGCRPRFVAWIHGEGSAEAGPRGIVQVLLIADDPKRLEAVVLDVARASRIPLVPWGLTEEQARAMAHDPKFVRVVEEGRVAHADAAWLRG